MPHLLDRPIWSALTTDQAHLSAGSSLARRHQPGISLFAATGEETPQALAALADLVRDDDVVVLVQAASITVPDTLVAVSQAVAVQMVLEQAIAPIVDDRIVPLGADDMDEMIALVDLTRPGPFAPGALALGRFWGIRHEGRLVAMAGERLRQTGWTEMSGVCSHPDMRGKGLGKLLSQFVSVRIRGDGRGAYLHCYESNEQAFRLYEGLGYRPRERMNVVVVRRP